MIVSWNELQRTCQKAFRGLGVPAGVDDDSAFAVLWLQARDLDALTPLDAALSALERTPPHSLVTRRYAGRDDVLDAGGQPAVSVASDALDFAVARAVERAARAEVLLTGVEGGIFVAGALAQYPVPGHRGRVEWCDGGTRRSLDVVSNRACSLGSTSVDSTERNGELARNEVRIVIDGLDRDEREDDRVDERIERSPAWRIDTDNVELERRAMHSVAHGIEVPGALWMRLLAFAKRTLVPATNASRERGAGGGNYND